jgi:hypothetical protein
MDRAPPIPGISLLWPDGARDGPPAGGTRCNESCPSDLGLAAAARGLCLETGDLRLTETLLLELTDDLDTIRYRQEVLEDLLRSPALQSGAEDLLPRLASLRRYQMPRERGEPLQEVAWRLGELEIYTECIGRLAALLESGGEPPEPGMATCGESEAEPRSGSAGGREPPRSRGLQRLAAAVRAIQGQPAFRSLVRELPELLSRIRAVRSITIGVNLDPDLQPREATLLAVSPRRFHGGRDSLLARLFGADREEERGIAPLHRSPTAGGNGSGPLLAPLFRDLADVLRRVSGPVAAALQRYLGLNTRFLGAVAAELAFYLGAARLVRRLQARGLPMCQPELAPAEEGLCRLRCAYNLNLALRFAEQEEPADLRRRIVLNDIEFGPRGTVFVLTGPNRGGKTTYLQAIGIVQLLAQAGLYVPAEQARVSPVDGIYTHFPAEERPGTDAGRLGEEAARLSAIFTRATRRSLILLNESLSSTSPWESLHLARDVLRTLRALGARAVYTTHHHQLAAEADELNAGEAWEGRIVSLVSLVDGHGGGAEAARPTFRIVPAPPSGSSHAAEIARRYGISYGQLLEVLRRRGVVP